MHNRSGLLPNCTCTHAQDREWTTEWFLTFLFYGVLPHAKVIKGSQSDEPDQTVKVIQLVLDGSTCHCPAVV